jgi:hypothetical protein
MTHASVTREPGWTALRRPPDVRLRERDQALGRLRAGQSGPEVAQGRERDEATLRAGVHALQDSGGRGLERATPPGRPA